MAAAITKGYTFGSSEQVTAAKLHSLVDSATISGIVNAEIAAAAAIAGSKLALGNAKYLVSEAHADLSAELLTSLLSPLNLLKNGSFEDSVVPVANTPSGWTLEGTPTVAPDTGIGWGVPKAIKITATGAGNEGLKQTLSGLKANTTYRIVWDSKATDGDTARLLTTGATTNADTDVTADSWANSVAYFVTDGSATDVVLKVVAKADTDIVWFDNIIVVEGNAPFAFSPHPNDQHLKAIDYQDATPTNYDYGELRMECGVDSIVLTNGETSVVTAHTFGTAFKKLLVVVVTLNSVQVAYEFMDVRSKSTTGFSTNIGVFSGTFGGQTQLIEWIAIGVG